MQLDVYRSCSRQEKREVLNTFWRSSSHESSRINEAALQYGPYAAACLFVIILEVVPLLAVSIRRGYAWSWLAVALEAVTVLSLWWSVVRLRALKSPLTH